jgi:two-component system, LytTR family, sensor kinase
MKLFFTWLPSILGSLIWLIIHSVALYSESGHLTNAILDASILSLLILLDTGGAAFMIRSHKPTLLRSFYLLLGNGIAAFLIISAYEFISSKLVEDGENLMQASGLQTGVITILCFVTLVCIGLVNWLLVIIEDRDIEKHRRRDEHELRRQSELNDLRQQLQPHFLFNSLNSIQSLLQFDAEKASQMITMLADFLRGSVQKDSSQLRQLSEELNHLKLYLDIETIRFEDRLKISIENNIKDIALVPALILQPLVENAIKFGLYGTIGKIEISIILKLENSILIIEISNPFDIDAISSKKGTGFGLSSVARRLHLIYLRNDLLQIRSEKGSFHVTLRIPQSNDTSRSN